jgi:hypothetical protein
MLLLLCQAHPRRCGQLPLPLLSQVAAAVAVAGRWSNKLPAQPTYGAPAADVVLLELQQQLPPVRLHLVLRLLL